MTKAQEIEMCRTYVADTERALSGYEACGWVGQPIYFEQARELAYWRAELARLTA
jgi:hypothetical protein